MAPKRSHEGTGIKGEMFLLPDPRQLFHLGKGNNFLRPCVLHNWRFSFGGGQKMAGSLQQKSWFQGGESKGDSKSKIIPQPAGLSLSPSLNLCICVPHMGTLAS